MKTIGLSVGLHWVYNIQDFGYFNCTGIKVYNFFNLEKKRI